MNDLNARNFRSAVIGIVSFLFLKITNDDEKGDKDTQWSAVKLNIHHHANFTDQLPFLGNCPPTPPLSQHFALNEKKVLMLA